MALKVERVLTRTILAWDPDGTFRGGQADWVDRVIDDVNGSEIARKETVGEPIAGALQPGKPLSELLGDTEEQRIATMQNEKDRADIAEEERDKLRRQLEDLDVEPLV